MLKKDILVKFPLWLYFILLFLKLQKALVSEYNRDGRLRDLEEVLRAAAYDPDAEDMIHTGKIRLFST